MKYILNIMLLQTMKLKLNLGEKFHLQCTMLLDSQNLKNPMWADHGCRKWCFKVRGCWSHHLFELKDIFQYLKTIFLKGRSGRESWFCENGSGTLSTWKSKEKNRDVTEKKLKKTLKKLEETARKQKPFLNLLLIGKGLLKEELNKTAEKKKERKKGKTKQKREKSWIYRSKE